MSIFNWFTGKVVSEERKKYLIEYKTLKEIVEYTKDMRIKDGGLAIMIEKLVWEIEQIKKKLEK